MALGVRLILTSSVSAPPVDNSGVIVINVDGDAGEFFLMIFARPRTKLFLEIVSTRLAPIYLRNIRVFGRIQTRRITMD